MFEGGTKIWNSSVLGSSRAHSRFPGAVCRQRWTVRLGEVEPVFGQTGRVVLDITARTAHDGALNWTRASSTPRAARSIFATFPSTCALPSGGRWSVRRVLQRPGRQRKRSCGPSRTSASAPASPPCCNARCAPPRVATRRAPACAAASGGQWEQAETHYQTALKQAHEIPFRSEQPEVRRWYAEMLLDRNAPGDRDKARTLLGEATGMYQTIGMPKASGDGGEDVSGAVERPSSHGSHPRHPPRPLLRNCSLEYLPGLAINEREESNLCPFGSSRFRLPLSVCPVFSELFRSSPTAAPN